jgi:hypothetical protein
VQEGSTRTSAHYRTSRRLWSYRLSAPLVIWKRVVTRKKTSRTIGTRNHLPPNRVKSRRGMWIKCASDSPCSGGGEVVERAFEGACIRVPKTLYHPTGNEAKLSSSRRVPPTTWIAIKQQQTTVDTVLVSALLAGSQIQNTTAYKSQHSSINTVSSINPLIASPRSQKPLQASTHISALVQNP